MSLMTLPGVFALLADTEAEPAGAIICRTAADEAELLTLAVRPDCERRGVGRALIAAAMTRLSNLEIRTFHLEVAADNASAIRLYERCGFQPKGQRPCYYRRSDGSVVDALLMNRPVEPCFVPEKP